MRKHRSPVSVLALAAIMAAMVIGCGSHPIEPTVEPLVLQAIHAGEPDRGDEALDALWLEVGGAFVVTAFVEEPEAVAVQTSLEALVTTDSGDAETVILQQALCEAAQLIHVCRRFGVTMNPGLHVRSLASALASEDLGWLSHSLSEARHGVIELPAGTEDISAAMAAVANLEGVEATWLDQVAGPDVIGWEPTQHLRGMLPMTFADAAPHDGVLQVHPGDEVTITYVQPDGTSLSTTIVVPQPDA